MILFGNTKEAAVALFDNDEFYGAFIEEYREHCGRHHKDDPDGLVRIDSIALCTGLTLRFVDETTPSGCNGVIERNFLEMLTADISLYSTETPEETEMLKIYRRDLKKALAIVEEALYSEADK